MMGNKSYQRLTQLFNSDKLPWVIIALGIMLRFIRYAHNPSLWFDEAVVGLDIINRSFSELIGQSPDWSSKHPFGFLVLVKLAVELFGKSEYALRLLPLTSGIFSFFLFYKVAKHYINPNACIIALGLFSIIDPLVVLSSDLKPYSSDITFALSIYVLAIYMQAKELNISRNILFGIYGALVIWFSYPTLFVLAGVGVCLAVFSLSKKDWARIWNLAIIYSMWALSFIAFYFIYIRNLQSNFDISVKEMLTVMEHAYMPLPPMSLLDIKWFIDLFFEIFSYPMGLSLLGISAMAFVIGCVAIYSHNRRNFAILTSPIFFTFLAAAIHQYPFKGRFIFFLVPLMLFFIAEGAEYIRSKTIQNAKVIGIIFISLLLFHPLLLSAYRIKRPYYMEEIKPVLSHIQNNWQKGDLLYVHYYAQYPFEYYSKYHPKLYKFKEGEYIIGIAPRGWYRHWRKQEVSKYYDAGVKVKQTSVDIFKIYAKDLDRLKGNKRVWVLFTGNIPKDGIIEEKFFIYHLETIGKQLDMFGRTGISSTYLYDLSEEALIVDTE